MYNKQSRLTKHIATIFHVTHTNNTELSVIGDSLYGDEGGAAKLELKIYTHGFLRKYMLVPQNIEFLMWSHNNN